MVKQKIVIKVSMEDPKKCSKKPLQIVTKFTGVISASLEGDQIVVVGEGLDSVDLMVALKKKMHHADLVSVASVEAKKEEKKVEAKKEEKKPTPLLSEIFVPPQIHYPCHYPEPCPYHYPYYCPYHYSEPYPCSIM